jgi:hypothetical protein
MAFKLGLNLKFSDTVQIAPLFKDDNIQGGLFKFSGLLMFLDLVPGGLKERFEKIPNTPSDWHYTELSKPFKQFKATHGKRVSHVVNFN